MAPDDVFGADQDDLEVGIGGKRFGHSLEHDARGIVSAHGIDAYRELITKLGIRDNL